MAAPAPCAAPCATCTSTVTTADTPLAVRALAERINSALLQATRHAIVVPAPGAGALLAAEIALDASRPVLLVSADDDDAAARTRDIRFFGGPALAATGGRMPFGEPALAGPVAHFPELDGSPYHAAGGDRRALVARLALLTRLAGDDPPRVLVASARAIARRVPPRQPFVAACSRIDRSFAAGRAGLAQILRAAGFARVPLVEDPGTYTVRGAVVDCFPPLLRQPVRIELDGDTIESLRIFDAESQRSLRTIDEVLIHPVCEALARPPADVQAALRSAAERCQVPSSTLRELEERLTAHDEQPGELLGLDAFAPLFHECPGTLLQHLPPETLVVIEQPLAVLERVRALYVELDEACARRRAEHQLALDARVYAISEDELTAALSRHLCLELLAATPPEPGRVLGALSCQDHAELRAELAHARAPARASGDALSVIATHIGRWLDADLRVRVVTQSQAHAGRVAAVLNAAGLHPTLPARDGELTHEPPASSALAAARAPSGAPLALVLGALSAGFTLAEDKVVFLSEADLFGRRALRTTLPPAARPRVELGTLREGDLIVHDEHGIGRYRGLRKLEVNGITQDFLHLEYDGGTIYLPIYRVGQVGRFSATGADHQVRLDKLGGRTFHTRKQRARADARKLAEELLQLYAERKARVGLGCAAPDAMFAAFEESFPFEETPDQARAIDDVLTDLQAPTPMDRLICGDVGYGKTEVAMRAALLAVESGRQVAVLTPTTVLCEQHARTFGERFTNFPVRIAALSRFCRPEEQRRTLAALADGRIDILVGTHRMLSGDVCWKNLGLVIIDEEQRFGVAHKERLKQLRAEVDVLTLSATPIPRTLQMALGGLRPMSVIATPPADRLAIRTFVCRFDPELLRAAITRELARGGQVFFVHNRIEDIARWAETLRHLAPGARIGIAHGQLRASRLERTMVDFVAGKFDILCCTTIVESGLDIPRANTLIVNHAEHFGLAQLYQLRGRVGRARERAYCYLVVSDEATKSPQAAQRLAALERFSHLGAGFHLAHADLEIRGAGEILGPRQSGALAGIGFEAYARILEEAVAELGGQPISRPMDPDISVNLPAFLPDDFVPEPGQRLELYRRLSQADDEDAVADLLREIEDRFGPLPREAILLGHVMAHKTLVRALGARAYELGPARMALALGPGSNVDPERLLALCRTPDSRLKLSPDGRLSYTFNDEERRDPPQASRRILRELLTTCRLSRPRSGTPVPATGRGWPHLG